MKYIFNFLISVVAMSFAFFIINQSISINYIKNIIIINIIFYSILYFIKKPKNK